MCSVIQDHIGLSSYLQWLLHDYEEQQCEIGQALLGEQRESEMVRLMVSPKSNRKRSKTLLNHPKGP